MDFAIMRQRLKQQHPALPVDSVVDVLVAKFKGKGTIYTPDDIANALPALAKPEILTVLRLLAAPPFRLLEQHWVFVDNEDEEHDLDANDVGAAEAAGAFHHPLTGAPVDQFEDAIYLYYAATPELETGDAEKRSC